MLVSGAKENEIFSKVCAEFSYSLEHISQPELVLESTLDPMLLVVSEFTDSKETTLEELIQISRQQFPDAYLLLVVDKELTKARFQFLSKLGVRIFFLKSELQNSKLSFAVNQILRASFVPLKSIDLVADVAIPFSVYHLMPSRKKFLPLLRAGSIISPERLARLCKEPEFYIHRLEIDLYKKFIESSHDRSAKGLSRRCRANFTALQTEFTNLVFELTDETNNVSYGDGQTLLGRCQALCDDLLVTLAEFPRAWEVINSSSIGEFGSIERAPALAAFCGIFSLSTDVAKISEVMLVSLLVDVAVAKLPLDTTAKIRDEKELSAEEIKRLRYIPQASVEMVLSRKMGLSESIRNILFGVYERVDGKGYPKGITEEKIRLESQIIRFAKEFDSRTLLKMGRQRVEPLDALNSILSDESLKGVFSEKFFEIVRNKILKSDIFAERKSA